MGQLSAMLAQATQSVSASSDSSWTQFILDHLDYIANRSTTYVIDAATMARYRYDLRRYLTEQLSLRLDIQWIVLRLNNLANDYEFDTPGKFVIPSDDLINRLYHDYVTITQNAF